MNIRPLPFWDYCYHRLFPAAVQAFFQKNKFTARLQVPALSLFVLFSIDFPARNRAPSWKICSSLLITSSQGLYIRVGLINSISLILSNTPVLPRQSYDRFPEPHFLLRPPPQRQPGFLFPFHLYRSNQLFSSCDVP